MASIQKAKGKTRQKGYTVIEVMIVLSVSAVLFAAAIVGYSRQNAKTHFTNAVRDMEVTLQDVLNDVSTGFYPSSEDFVCARSGSPAVTHIRPPAPDDPPPNQGTNQDCIFLGKAVDIETGSMTVYTIAGLRNKSTDQDARSTTLQEAENRLVRQDGTFGRHILNASIGEVRVITPPAIELGGFAVISGFGDAGGSGGAGATTNQVSIASINNSYNFSSSTGRVLNNSDGNKDIIICIEEAGGGRQASITIGEGAQTNIETMIDGWRTECG